MKPTIAFVTGGYSGESVISYKSAITIENNIDKAYIGQSTWMISCYLAQAISDIIVLFEDKFIRDILDEYLPLYSNPRLQQRYLASEEWTRLPRILLGNALVVR